MFNENTFYQKKNERILLKVAEENIPANETILVALKGTFKEYLFCTNLNVYIIKKGFMTGHLFGGGNFRMPYNKITNAEVNMSFLSGYFELSSAGLENKRLNYWASNPNEDPAKQPNCISIQSTFKNDFIKASEIILQKINSINQNNLIQNQNYIEKSSKEQLHELKEMLEEGLITQEEYDQKKKQILGL